MKTILRVAYIASLTFLGYAILFGWHNFIAMRNY